MGALVCSEGMQVKRERIPKGLMDELRKKLGDITPQAVYQRIHRIQGRYKPAISLVDGACVLAAEKTKIHLAKYFSVEQTDRTRELVRLHSGSDVMPVKKRGAPRPRVLKVHTEEISDPLLPASIVEQAREMTEAYMRIYVFENSIRHFIRLVLEKRYGKQWWDHHVGHGIRTKVAGRMQKEKRNAWHGKRGAHEIFYTDIGDLKSIIARNHTDFDPLFKGLPGGRGWLEQRIAEIELSRNIVDHHNPLGDRDVKRIRMYLEDWQTQLEAIKDQL